MTPPSRGAPRAREPRPARGGGIPPPSRAFQRSRQPRCLSGAAETGNCGGAVSTARLAPSVVPPARTLALSHHDTTLLWGRARTPTLISLSCLARHVPPARHDALLAPPPPLTEMALADCRGLPDSLCCAGSSLEEVATFFKEQLEPTALAINTREGYYDCWRSFVSYAYLHDALDEAMPATPHLVKAYLWNLLQCKYKPGTVTSHIYAVIDHHRSHGAAFPFSSRAVKCFIDAFER
eukprot:1439674-Rhodomonas_salina.1